MDRKEFLASLGKGAASVCMACYLASCANNSTSIPTAPSNVDFTLDLTQSPNQNLNNVGGYIYKDGIIIGRLSQTEFVAVSEYCTHQGTMVIFQKNSNRFYCPTHGSTYDINGNVTNGPANRPLAKYNTQFSGNSLRVYS